MKLLMYRINQKPGSLSIKSIDDQPIKYRTKSAYIWESGSIPMGLSPEQRIKTIPKNIKNIICMMFL
jgi:hypothetical protein